MWFTIFLIANNLYAIYRYKPPRSPFLNIYTYIKATHLMHRAN